MTASSNGRGYETGFVYDALNRQIVVVDPLDHRTTTLYDAVGNVTAVQDATGNTTTFAYDGLGRVTSQTDALGHTATFAYNAAGLLTGTTDPAGQQRAFAFDDVNQLTTETWYNAAGTAVNTLTYSYDENGNQLTAADEDGTYTFSYDALNRVSVVQDLWGITQTFTYDAADNRTRVEDSFGGVQTSTYDAANRLTNRDQTSSGTTLHLEFTYTDRGEVETIRRYTGATSPFPLIAATSYSYDGVGQVTNLHHTDGSGNNLANYTYTYDDGGRLTTETDDGTTTTYTYDDTNQLTGDGSNSYSYDGTGNRTNTGYTTSTGNQLTSDGLWSYTYDANGNEASKTNSTTGETWAYGYDNDNHLISAVEKDASNSIEVQVEYKYDALKNRVERDVDTDGDGIFDQTQKYAFDGWNPAKAAPIGNENFQLWGELDSTGSLTTRYVPGDAVDQVFARIAAAGSAYWLLGDHLGSIRTVLDNSTDTVKDNIRYDGYGNVISESDATYGGRYKWTSREFDTETQLQYNRRRYYEPAAGRWISQDPLGFEAGDSNLYRYVHNQPTRWTDPSGLQSNVPWHLIPPGHTALTPHNGKWSVWNPQLGLDKKLAQWVPPRRIPGTTLNPPCEIGGNFAPINNQLQVVFSHKDSHFVPPYWVPSRDFHEINSLQEAINILKTQYRPGSIDVIIFSVHGEPVVNRFDAPDIISMTNAEASQFSQRLKPQGIMVFASCNNGRDPVDLRPLAGKLQRSVIGATECVNDDPEFSVDPPGEWLKYDP